EVMVAPFAIPVCSLLDEYGEFQGPRMAVTDRIFTEAARYCEGEVSTCNNYPMWAYTPCSCQYEQHGDEYLWSEEDLRPLGASYYADYYSPSTDPDDTRGTYLGDFDANPGVDYFCYHRMHWGGFGLYWDWSGIMVNDLGNYIPGLPFKEWFSSNTELPFQGGNNDYPTYGIGWFGKTEIMASDHTGVVGLPERAEQLLGLSEESVLSVIDGPGTVQARLGEGYHILPSGITQATAQERVWNQISNNGMADTTHPAMDQTELGTIQKNHVEVTISSRVPEGGMGLHLTTHVGFLGHPDPAVEEQEWDWVNGDYIWDYGLCPSRRVKLQCATRGDDLCVTPKQGRLDVEWGAPAPAAADLTSWWDENEMARIGLDGDEDPTTWEWSLSDLFEMFGASDPRPELQDYATYEEWEPANAIWEYVQSIRWHWDRNGVVARLFVVPEDDVTDQTPVWKVKVPIIAVRGPDGLRCQDVDANHESPPGTVAWTDPVVDPSADWEVIGFVDMYVYDVSIGGISGDSVSPLSQSGYYDLPADTFPPQNAPGKDGYGPLPFYFFSEPGLDIGHLNNGEANIRPANAVRARVTLSTDFIPTSANEGSRSPRLVQGWGRR
ncbi:MAG: hypothetical protein QUV05_14515, partial [Phycisphaerae bacterium]|nr:hypothetical protein [Phycisphaerae bacterium]